MCILHLVDNCIGKWYCVVSFIAFCIIMSLSIMIGLYTIVKYMISIANPWWYWYYIQKKINRNYQIHLSMSQHSLGENELIQIEIGQRDQNAIGYSKSVINMTPIKE